MKILTYMFEKTGTRDGFMSRENVGSKKHSSRKRICLPLIFLSAFLMLFDALILPVSAENILFNEDFSAGLGAWTGVREAAVQEGKLVLPPTGATERVRVTEGFDWTDVDIEFDATIRRIQAAWTLRERDGNYYMFILRGPVLSRFVVFDGVLHAGDVELDPPVKQGEEAQVRVEARGSVIRHYINGRLIDSWTDDQLTKGTFGFRQAAGDSASFDNIVVRKASLSEDALLSSPATFASVPFTESPPSMDGRIDEEEWSTAARFGGFSDLTGSVAERDTRVWTMWDKEKIYFAFESPKRFQREIPRLKRDDGALFRDDSIEINLMPEEGGPWYKLAFNPAGSKWDARFKGREGVVEWQGSWDVRNHLIHDDLFVTDIWQAEVSVAWQELGVEAPSPGEKWRVQFCRNYDDVGEIDYQVSKRWTSWSPAVEGGFNHPDTFGEAHFVKDSPVLRFDEYASLEDGWGGLTGVLTSPADRPVLRMSARRAAGDRAYLMREEVPIRLDGAGTFDIRKPISVEVISGVVFEWDISDPRSIAGGTARVTVSPSFAVDFVPVFLLGKVWVEVDISRIPDRPSDGLVTARIEDEKGLILRSETYELEGDDRFRFAVSLDGLDAGGYSIIAELKDDQDAEDTPIASAATELEIPPEPAWAGTASGALERVPPPWSPVRVEEEDGIVRIETFAKQYTFSGGLFPDGIELRGDSFLDGPARLMVDTGTGLRVVRPGTAMVSDLSDLGVTLDWSVSDEDIELRARARVEFDGLIWYDLHVQSAGERPVRDVWLEAPLRREGLRYMRGRNSMNFLRGHWMTALIGDARLDRAYPDPAETGVFSAQGWKWSDQFANFLWIGGVDRGLFTLLPSPRWLPDGGPFHAMEEDDGILLLRVRLAGGAQAGREPLDLSFGLMGTPTRPMNAAFRDRMNRTGFNNIPRIDPASLDLYLGRMDGQLRDKYFTGPNLVVEAGDLHAGVVSVGAPFEKGYPDLDQAALERLDARRAVLKGAGMEKTLLWCDLTYATITYGQGPLFEAEWERHPPQRNLYQGHYATLICPATDSWKDFYLYHVGRLMEEGRINGVYLDMTGPGSCRNPYHGCGYERDGERHGEIPILALRELFLRLYNTVKTHDPDGIVFYHSQVFTPFSLYADLGTRGENWAGAESYRTFSLPYYQAAYMVHRQYGVPFSHFTTLNYAFYTPPERISPLSEVVGLSLLHDTLPCPMTSQQIPGLVTVWNALRDFGAYDETTVWTPYWENNIGDWEDGIAVSSYRNKSGEKFIVAFNPDFDENKKLRLNIKDLGVRESYNIITGESTKTPVSLMTIEPRDIRLLWLR